MLGLLVVGGQYFHSVAAAKGFAHRHKTVVDASAYAVVADVGMDVIGKVENCGALGEFQKVALRGEHEHLVFVEVHLELVHHLKVVVAL